MGRTARGGKFLEWRPHPLPEALARVEEKTPDALLARLDAAIVERDQAFAAALVARWGEAGHPHALVFDVLRRHATLADGALHAEKYFQTAVEEFAATRPAYRWRHVVSLARVTASESGRTAPGVEEAKRLLEA